ncbi:MAG: aminomethyltransferase family protein, partial [Pseudomonadota bacterium]
ETSKLTKHFAPARDLWVPVSFPSTGTVGEYWACREAVTVQDMSGLRKYDIVGPDAERLLQKTMTRDVARLAVWRGTYALICDEAGAVIDDGTLFRLGPDQFRWCCGHEESARALNAIAQSEGLQARILAMGSALPNLAVQGPSSRDVLRRFVFTQASVPELDDLKWFGVTVGRVGDRDGIPFMLSRSGYTGELGYELFCAKEHATTLWHAIMEAGAEFGIKPMGSAALDLLRVEAGLAAANAEFAPGVDALEAGLGFAVNFKKSDFVGKAALERNAEAPRKLLKGLWFQGDDVPAHGAHVYHGERPVGVVTSAVRSPMFERAIAIARVAVEFADTGTELEVGQLDGHMKRLPATVCDIPFYDPKRERARA